MLKGLRFFFDLMLDRAKTLLRRRRRHAFAWNARRFSSPVREVTPEVALPDSNSHATIR
jgi:hypothetical protein